MTLRRIAPLELPPLQLGPIAGTPPRCAWVAPTDLFVDPRARRSELIRQ